MTANATETLVVSTLTPLLTVDDLAAYQATLYAWRSRGLGPRAIKVGGELRYRRSEVEAWLDEQTDRRD